MTDGLLKEINLKHSKIHFWHSVTFSLLPYIAITMNKKIKYFELSVGWLCWSVNWFK